MILTPKLTQYAFKDVALQFLGNLFEYFLVRKNQGKIDRQRSHLTVIGATSGDTGSAAIYGLRGKADLSIFMLHPKDKVSRVQERQMTTILDPNVYNLSVEGSFDDCQDIVKALFADPQVNQTHKLGAVNSINWARILAQIVYYIHSYFSLVRSPHYDKSKSLRFVVPSGNFGDILAGWFVTLQRWICSESITDSSICSRFAKRMGLPCSRLVIATNNNDILHRFMTTGTYSKRPVYGAEASGGSTRDGVEADASGVKGTWSPAMDILVSSNFERLLAFLAYEVLSGSPNPDTEARLQIGRSHVSKWLQDLKTTGGFTVDPALLAAAREDFSSERVDNDETIGTIKSSYLTFFPKVENSEGTTGKTGGYILDPHSAIGIAASMKSISSTEYTISLATAHPAKFEDAVHKSLTGQTGYSFDDMKPQQFKEMDYMESRVRSIGKDDRLENVKSLIIEKIPASEA